jgi:hypothetical protein
MRLSVYLWGCTDGFGQGVELGSTHLRTDGQAVLRVFSSSSIAVIRRTPGPNLRRLRSLRLKVADKRQLALVPTII